MNPISKKLRLKPGMPALVVAAPSAYLKSLAPLPEGVVISEAMGGTHEFVQFFATSKVRHRKIGEEATEVRRPRRTRMDHLPEENLRRRERPQSGGSLGGNGGDGVASGFPDCHRRSLVGAAFSTNRGRQETLIDDCHSHAGYWDGMDIERTIDDIEQLEEMFEAAILGR